MFAERYGSKIGRLMCRASDYHPFPTAVEREPWEALRAGLRTAAIRRGRALLGTQRAQLPATLYVEYARTGDRQQYERPYFSRRQALGSLVLAECMEGKGRFLDDICNGIWAICEESSWCIPAHNSGGALPDTADPIVDLFAAETGSLLAWTWYLLRESLTAIDPRLSERIKREVGARILDPFLGRDDFWWMGIGSTTRLNNWSPWCTSTCLAAFAILERDERRRRDAVAKSLHILDRFLAGYQEDGGCDEGPSYWTVAGGALFDCLEVLFSMSGGRIDVYSDPLIQAIGRYVYRAHVSGDYFVNFADCPGKVRVPSGLVYRYGRRIGDEDMAAFGSYCYRQQGRETLLNGSLLRVLPDFFYAEGIGRRARAPLPRDVWLSGTELLVAREAAGTDRGFCLAAKGGHNDESHNHNDVGQFVLYSDGEPVLIDPGVGVYTRETFSDRRYEIWTMRSAYHNLPTVNGVEQGVGGRYRATRVRCRGDDEHAELACDLARAYPKESRIRSWRRACRLDRVGPAVEITDAFELERATREVTISLMTPCRTHVVRPGVLRLRTKGHAVDVVFAPGLDVQVEPIQLDDERLKASWGKRLYRVLLRPRRATRKAVWRLRVTRV